MAKAGKKGVAMSIEFIKKHARTIFIISIVAGIMHPPALAVLSSLTIPFILRKIYIGSIHQVCVDGSTNEVSSISFSVDDRALFFSTYIFRASNVFMLVSIMMFLIWFAVQFSGMSTPWTESVFRKADFIINIWYIVALANILLPILVWDPDATIFFKENTIRHIHDLPNIITKKIVSSINEGVGGQK